MRLLAPQYNIDQTMILPAKLSLVEWAKDMMPEVRAELERSIRMQDYLSALMLCNDVYAIIPDELPGFFTTEMVQTALEEFRRSHYGNPHNSSMAGLVLALSNISKLPVSELGWDMNHLRDTKPDLIHFCNSTPLSALAEAALYKIIYPDQDIAGLFQPYAFDQIIPKLIRMIEVAPLRAVDNLMFARILWPEKFNQSIFVNMLKALDVTSLLIEASSDSTHMHLRTIIALRTIMASSCEVGPNGVVLGDEWYFEDKNVQPLPDNLLLT